MESADFATGSICSEAPSPKSWRLTSKRSSSRKGRARPATICSALAIGSWIIAACALSPASSSLSNPPPGGAKFRTSWHVEKAYNSWRRPLHSHASVILLVPVPPSLRQAAGPLIENLPNVCAFCLLRAEASRRRTSPRGKVSRLSSRVKNPAPAFLAAAVLCAEGLREVQVHDKRGYLA